jgi:HlyD family secretion protein
MTPQAVVTKVKLYLIYFRKRLFSGADNFIEGLTAEAGRGQTSFLHKSEAALIEEAPVGLPSHIILYVIVGFIFFALMFCIFGSVDRIVVATGKVTTRSPLVVLQPYSTSKISKIYVRPGDVVKKGQVLVTFDPTFSNADEAALKQKVDSLASEISRIQAELSGSQKFTVAGAKNLSVQAKGSSAAMRNSSDPIKNSVDLSKNTTDGTANDPFSVQSQLFNQRRSQHASDIAERDARIKQLDVQIAEHQESLSHLRRQVDISLNIFEIRRKLEAASAGSRLDTVLAEKENITEDLKLKSVISDLDKLQQEKMEYLSERSSYSSKWFSELSEQLSKDMKDWTAASQEYQKASRMRELSDMRAPMDGVVLELSDRSEGSVLREAETLLTLVPANAVLLVDANISSRDIGYVKAGYSVQVKLEAYPFQQFGTVDAQLVEISPDSIVEKDGDKTNTVFHTQIKLNDSLVGLLKRGIKLHPGLIVTADIKTGRRSIISYLSDPIIKTANEGLREP